MGSYYTLYTIFYNSFYVPNIIKILVLISFYLLWPKLKKPVFFSSVGPSLVSNQLPIFGAKNQTEPDLYTLISGTSAPCVFFLLSHSIRNWYNFTSPSIYWLLDRIYDQEKADKEGHTTCFTACFRVTKIHLKRSTDISSSPGCDGRIVLIQFHGGGYDEHCKSCAPSNGAWVMTTLHVEQAGWQYSRQP